jgi:protein-S-isoprenylcysteine O-methyltransferase Ste14
VGLRALVNREEAALNAWRTGVGAIVAALGISLTVAGARHFARRRANIVTFNAPTELVVDGLFSVSRNPMYLGFALLLGGVAMVLGGIVTFLPTVLFVLAAEKVYIPFEEQAMRRIFGERYVDYASRVRRWFGRRASV